MSTFETLNTAFWKQFEQGLEVAFATSAENIVTNRVVMVAPGNGKLYLLTAVKSTKYRQMLKNPNVGLCAGMTQVTAAVRLPGDPLDAVNSESVTAYRKVFETWYNEYSAKPGHELVEINPLTAVLYIEEGENAGGWTLDFATGTANRIS